MLKPLNLLQAPHLTRAAPLRSQRTPSSPVPGEEKVSVSADWYKTQLTQVGRALAHLGIEHIAAYSPEARGRSERAFRTLQDRMPKELRLAGITTVEGANAWLAATYIGEYNAAFAIAPLDEGSAFVADTAEVLRETLCIIEERVVAKDNTVASEGRRLQIPPSRLRPHFVKATVRVHEYRGGKIAVFLGPHRLAEFTAEGVAPVAAPTHPILAACPEPSRRGLAMAAPASRMERRPTLTAPARDAVADMRVGTKERAAGRTKELTKTGSRQVKSRQEGLRQQASRRKVTAAPPGLA